MKIIDSHIHYSDNESFRIAALKGEVDYSEKGLDKEMLDNQVEKVVIMGCSETTKGELPDIQAPTPMLHGFSKLPEKVYYCAGINPHDLGFKALENLSISLDDPKCVGVKIYAGYYHFYVYDEVYEPVYKMALERDMPIVVHGGSTYSSRGLLKYSHPLTVDEMAYKYPHNKIIVAHLGNPWIFDCVELMYKHSNVYSDLSGILEGTSETFNHLSSQSLYMDRYQSAILSLNDPSRLLYGSDWPLAKMHVYIDFIKKMLPKDLWEDVFFNNAKRVFMI